MLMKMRQISQALKSQRERRGKKSTPSSISFQSHFQSGRKSYPGLDITRCCQQLQISESSCCHVLCLQRPLHGVRGCASTPRVGALPALSVPRDYLGDQGLGLLTTVSFRIHLTPLGVKAVWGQVLWCDPALVCLCVKQEGCKCLPVAPGLKGEPAQQMTTELGSSRLDHLG